MNDQKTIADKNLLRKRMKSIRENISDRESSSTQILHYVTEKFLTAPKSICVFVSKHPEVETNQWIQKQLEQGKHRIIVPFCDGPNLKLYRLKEWTWLTPSQFGLLETATEYRTEDYLVPTQEIDVFLVPGLAFDHSGNRLGYGKGFYDRLLSGKRPDAPSVALAFSQQIIAQVPTKDDWDQKMNFVQTEKELLNCN